MSKTSIELLPDVGVQHGRASGETMGTRWSAQFHARIGIDVRAIVGDLAQAVETVDAQMSTWRADSDLCRLNRAVPGDWVFIPAPLSNVLVRAADIARDTDNAFDIGVGDLVDAWGFGPRGEGVAPMPDAAARCRPLDEVLEIDPGNRRARRLAPVTFDLGGIAKGFGVDELARVLDRHGVGSWLVGIDGEMRARGAKPDGTAWAIGIEMPEFDRRSAIGVIELGDAAIATSGDYRHWRQVDGERIAHTMDPRTGAPLRNDVASVTVIAPDCTSADAYATALMVLGPEDGSALAERLGLEVLFMQRRGSELRTSGTGCFAEQAE